MRKSRTKKMSQKLTVIVWGDDNYNGHNLIQALICQSLTIFMIPKVTCCYLYLELEMKIMEVDMYITQQWLNDLLRFQH